MINTNEGGLSSYTSPQSQQAYEEFQHNSNRNVQYYEEQPNDD